MHNHDADDLLAKLLPDPLTRSLRRPNPSAHAVSDGCALLAKALREMSAFVPSPALDVHLAQPERGWIDGLNLNGTTLLITVVNFSTVSSQFSARGRQATEDLGTEVARIAEMVLHEVYTRGGGLVKFSGESFTAFFDRRRLRGSHAAQACAAALALCRHADTMGGLDANAHQPLWIHVSAHSGLVFAAEVGDAQQAELIVTGRAVNRVVRQQGAAGHNKLVISEATLRELDRPIARPLYDDLYHLEALAEEPPRPLVRDPLALPDNPSVETLDLLLSRIQALRPYMHHGMPQQLWAGGPGGEFRPVTVVCSRFYAFSRLLRLLELSALIEGDNAIIGQVLNAYYNRVSAAFRRYGGSIHRVDMATFGDRLMAIFGAPSGHEDDPARAVRAALSLERALEEARHDIRALIVRWARGRPEHQAFTSLGIGLLRQRVGVATGTVFAGLVGLAQRHEYTVLGEAVAQAGRLLAAANDGDVLIAAATHSATRSHFVTQPLPASPSQASEPSSDSFRVVGPASAAAMPTAAHATPLIGRHVELARLHELVATALNADNKAGHVISITGEVGSGKSRLADEALRQLPPWSLLLREACQSYEESVPYAVIARLLVLLLDLGSADGREAQSERLRAYVERFVPAYARFAPLLGALLDLPLPETELTLALDPERRQERMRATIIQLCLAMAEERPLVLLVDDLQWADPSSYALLAHLSEALAGHPLLLLLLYRSNAGLAEPWRDLPHHSAIALGNLGPNESAALLTALLHDAPPPQLHTLIERAHGLPLFLEELVRYLCEAGQLRRNHGAWSYHTPDIGAVPSQIEQIIVSRLDRLAPNTRRLLQVAAVLGQRFSQQLLGAVATDVGTPLDALIDAAILVRDDSPEGGYRFRLTLVREVVYANTLFAQRRALHAQAAAAVEQLFAARIDRYRVVLSQHYRGSGQLERAYEQLVLAAHTAQARYANHEALALYEQARALAPWRKRAPHPVEQTRAAELIESSGDVCARLSDNAGARAHYEALLELIDPFEGTHWALRRGATQRKIGGTYEHQGSMDAALLWYVRALDTLAPLDPGSVALERARLLSDMGWLYFRRNELEPARRELEAALALTVPLEAHDLAAQIHNRLGGLAWTLGDLATARHYVEQRLISTQQTGDLAGQASAYNNLGIIAETQGRQDDALDYSQQALAISEQIGSLREAAIAANTSGMALYNAGQPEPARSWFAQAHERATAGRDTYLGMVALLNMSRALALLGHWEETERTVRQSQFIAAQMNLPIVQLAGQTVLAEAALARDDLDAAVREYHVARAFAADESEEYARFLRVGARIAHAEGDVQQRERHLDEAEALFEQLQNVPELERTRALRAALCQTCERVKEHG